MKFEEAVKLLNSVNMEKWNSRYKPNDKYIYMGCEGRIMKRNFWKDTFFFSSNLLNRDWFENKTIFPKNKLIFVSVNDNLPFADKRTDDWEVYDIMPNDIVKVEIGEVGLWG